MKSRLPHALHPALGFAAEISACSLLHTSNDHNVLRSCSSTAPPTSSFIASVAAIEATTFTAVFSIPEVSQVSTMPRGVSGKMHARQDVLPGNTFNVTP